VRTLVLGGARSGKSTYAESLLAGHRGVRYVATGYPDDDDPDWAARVAAHRARRPADWSTVETDDPVPVLADASTPVLVDCLSLWLTRVFDRHDGWESADVPDPVTSSIDALVEAWRTTTARVVGVSNEVGLGVIPATVSGRRFRDALGALNRRVAAASDEVWLVVAGLPLRLR
jgi:adenosylcobinamide kinase / adenosylcobinamide-phosphate guanylyltransferase